MNKCYSSIISPSTPLRGLVRAHVNDWFQDSIQEFRTPEEFYDLNNSSDKNGRDRNYCFLHVTNKAQLDSCIEFLKKSTRTFLKHPIQCIAILAEDEAPVANMIAAGICGIIYEKSSPQKIGQQIRTIIELSQNFGPQHSAYYALLMYCNPQTNNLLWARHVQADFRGSQNADFLKKYLLKENHLRLGEIFDQQKTLNDKELTELNQEAVSQVKGKKLDLAIHIYKKILNDISLQQAEKVVKVRYNLAIALAKKSNILEAMAQISYMENSDLSATNEVFKQKISSLKDAVSKHSDLVKMLSLNTNNQWLGLGMSAYCHIEHT